MDTASTRVHPQLTIADITAARTNPMDSFDAVITVCQDSIEDHIPEGVDYHFFEMADGPSNAYGGRHDYDFFEEAAETILKHLEEGDRVLVHCHQGASRSVSTSIAALAVSAETDYHQMYQHTEERRPQIHPDGLLEQHAQRFIEERVEGINHLPFSGEVDDGV